MLATADSTLGARVARRDERRFVGRRAELGLFDRLFVDDPPASVVFVHGPGGIGKSTLLREVARRGARRGWRPRLVDGRELPPVPEALEQALGGVRDDERPLLLFDTYERIAAIGGYLRQLLLPSLSERAVVVVAGRRPPEPGWFEGGWEAVAAEVELAALADSEALELLRSRGIPNDAQAAAVARWAQGSPLALTLAAEIARADPGWRPEVDSERPELTAAVIERIGAGELDTGHRAALAAASIARVTTRRLLADVLAERGAGEAYDWLASRTFAEPVAEGLALHELVRRAVRADLRRRDPELERDLRRRIADHLHARAVAGNLLLAIDLAALIETPILRWGFGWEGSARYRIDAVRPGDAAVAERFLCERGLDEWWAGTVRFFAQAPKHIAVARDAADAFAGYMIAVTPASAPAFAASDPVLGPWLEHARTHVPDGNAVLWRDAIDMTRDLEARVQAMLGMTGILHSGLPNPRYAYLPINPRNRTAVEYSAALGAVHTAELDRAVGKARVECHILDYGPGGVLGMERDVIYRELGLAPPPPTEAGSQAQRRAMALEAVRAALRNLDHPHELATNPLAAGATPEERARSLRAQIGDAAEKAFGETEDERLLRRVLVRGYLDPAPSHELAAEELILSRSSYFRKLRQATERVADYIAQQG